jgi:kynurenine formamidase
MRTRFVDLTHTLAPGLPCFPGDPQLRFMRYEMPERPCNLMEMTLPSHQGTHLDAPYHFYADGRSVEQIALERFYGPATLIDLAPGGTLPARTPITIAHFEPYAQEFKPAARILYRTGWDRHFGHREFFTEYPTLTLDAARWIAQRRIGLLGMDTPTPSVDARECHLILLAPGVEIVLVEGLRDLGRLPRQFVFSAFPLKIQRGDGSSVRAVAMIVD